MFAASFLIFQDKGVFKYIVNLFSKIKKKRIC